MKTLRVDQLAPVLQQLPRGHSVGVNAVGNLAVLDAAGEYVGYIDFVHGSYEPTEAPR